MNGRIARAVLSLTLCAGCASTAPAARLPAGSGRALTGAAPAPAEPEPLRPATTRAAPRTAACVLLGFDIGVSPDGGITLSYTAVPGRESALRENVRGRVREHNARAAKVAGLGRDAVEAAFSSVAIAAETPDGARVLLMPASDNDAASLFANTELYAPDLMPTRRELGCYSEAAPTWSRRPLPAESATAVAAQSTY